MKPCQFLVAGTIAEDSPTLVEDGNTGVSAIDSRVKKISHIIRKV